MMVSRSYDTDVTLEDIAELTDVFYIGGTKVGHYVVKQLFLLRIILQHTL